MVGMRNAVHAEESAEVEVLYANLEKLNSLTKKIQGSMARLETSGKVVKDAIGPIYSNTQSLQVTNANIDKVNEAIDRLRQPLDVKGKEESIIRAGPRSAGLAQYLGALKRVDRALSDLNSTNLRSNQKAVSEFSTLLGTGSSKLQDMFKTSLRANVATVEPLHYITKQLPFPTIPSETVLELSPVCAAISSAANHGPQVGQPENPAIRIYADIRAPYITTSLQNLATASLNTAKRKPSDGPYRQGTNGIGMYASGIEGMLLAEHENISKIFPPEEQAKALQATCRPAIAEFSKTQRELNMYIKANPMTDCFLAFEIIEIVTGLSYRLDSATRQLKPLSSKPCDPSARPPSPRCLNCWKKHAAKLQLLADVMNSLSALTAYSNPLASILTSLGDGNWKTSSKPNTTPLDVSPDSSTILSHFILDMIEALLSALEARARTFHRAKPALGTFLANVMCVVDRSIRNSSELSRYLSTSENSTRLDIWRKKGVSIYLDAWRDPSSHLLDVQYTSRAGARPTSGGQVDSVAIVKTLSSKDKDNIKDKFKAFNSSFDELIIRHRSLSMEKEVRTMLAREVQAVIEPLYARFWDRYHEIDKGKGKYVKYDKATLSAQLAALA
ncbi:hypothetical protein ACJ72_00794 [Emergomyces africanus]|uniref:Exocyst complex protein EXO70 n=1 Tax=Emergomyces africanus TaxID=1955775 RepID=A0A1B7P727_9EURO|nr:hypothetical protein ACJ72_00794 [Emergomyces africanus]